MVVYCTICNKEFKYPYLLVRHYNNKTQCKPNDTNKQEEKPDLSTVLNDVKEKLK